MPAPVLLNTSKHHAAALRDRIRRTIETGPDALEELADGLVVIGTELMDLYVGRFAPAEIGQKIRCALAANHRLSLALYRSWVQEGGGYQVVELSEDASRWVLRMGDEHDRYVHVHPARWAPQTRRVRANVLKTAVMVLAHTGIHGGDPLDLARVNQVRREYLDLSPLGKMLTGDQGIGAVIDVLQANLPAENGDCRS